MSTHRAPSPARLPRVPGPADAPSTWALALGAPLAVGAALVVAAAVGAGSIGTAWTPIGPPPEGYMPAWVVAADATDDVQAAADAADELGPDPLSPDPLSPDARAAALPPGSPHPTPSADVVDVDLAPGTDSATRALTSSGIPRRAQEAYRRAARLIAHDDPTCHLTWPLLAGIGRVESNHGRFGGSGYGADGRVTPAILGPRLDGSRAGWATIHDTDGGRYDGDAAYDRAVGPMQFLPGTWTSIARDADGDGRVDPQDLDDAADAAGRYLCAGGGDLATQAGRWQAVYRYNRSDSYVGLVLSLADSYATGHAARLPTPPPGPRTPPTDGPATTGQPPAVRPAPRPSTPTPTTTAATPTTGTPTTGTPTPTSSGPLTTSPSPTGASTSPDPTTADPTTSGPSPTTTTPAPTTSPGDRTQPQRVPSAGRVPDTR